MEFIAHRGLSGAAPENTAAAFNEAASLGFRNVELDVLFTADDVPVVCHDDDLSRFGHQVLVSQQPWANLQTLDMGSWYGPSFHGERLLALDAALDQLSRQFDCINIELKPELNGHLTGPRSLRLTEQLARARAQGLALLMSSFDPRLVSWCQQHCPELPRAVLVEGPLTRAHEQLADLTGASAVHLDNDHLKAEDISRIKAQGLTARAYTVNEPARARALKQWGCDGIFTDILSPGSAP